MKVYEKPALTLLTVSANDALCACTTKLSKGDSVSYTHLTLPTILLV